MLDWSELAYTEWTQSEKDEGSGVLTVYRLYGTRHLTTGDLVGVVRKVLEGFTQPELLFEGTLDLHGNPNGLARKIFLDEARVNVEMWTPILDEYFSFDKYFKEKDRSTDEKGLLTELTPVMFEIQAEKLLDKIFAMEPAGADDLVVAAWEAQKPMTVERLNEWWQKINRTDPIVGVNTRFDFWE